MGKQKINGDFAVPELTLNSDGYGGFSVALTLTGARTCECPAGKLEDAKRDLQSLEASMWLASVVPIGKPGTSERRKAMPRLAKTLEQCRETGLAIIDGWIQELQAAREQLVKEAVRLKEVNRVEDVIDI